MGEVDLSVIILTYNEELNIEECLQSVHGWAKEIFLVDSYSSDGTLAVAKKYTEGIYQHKFEGYPQQRNWAIDSLPLSTPWVLFLDADERVSSELKKEIEQALQTMGDHYAGFHLKLKFIFMNRWIRFGGYYPVYVLRLFKREFGRCDERGINEHFRVNGKTRPLQAHLLHEDRRDVSFWINKHNRYATLEAMELIKKDGAKNGYLNASFWGTQAERKRWMREKVWNRLPPLMRPVIYFFYRYFLRLGFLDGLPGLIYHFLHGLWYPFLIDVKYLEKKYYRTPEAADPVSYTGQVRLYNASNQDRQG